MMTAPDVLQALDALSAAGVEAWIGGGWGIDAIVGRQTRDHADLDLAVPDAGMDAAITALAALGYSPATDWRPVRLALRDAAGREVDLHPLSFAADGSATQAGLDGGSFHYPPDGFAAGVIGDRPVPCLSARQQMAFHEGYAPQERDRHDVTALARHTGLAVPPRYRTGIFRPGADVPQRLATADLVLRPLLVSDADLDYDAVMASAEILRRWGGGCWPWDGFAIDDNREDLDVHEREHRSREAYTFTVLAPDESSCLGCVYVFPLQRLLGEETTVDNPDTGTEGLDPHRPVVTMWVRSDRAASGLDRRLFDAVASWLATDWSLETWHPKTNERLTEQVDLFLAAGCRRRYLLNRPDVRGGSVLFDPPARPGRRS